MISTEVGVEVQGPTSGGGVESPTQAGEGQATMVRPGDPLSALAGWFYGDPQPGRLIFEGTNDRQADGPTSTP